MDKNVFEDVAQMYCEYISDVYDSGMEDAPDELYTKEGYLKMFREWLEAFEPWLEENKNEYGSFEHVLEHFDEVSAEEFDPDDEPGIYIPVIK